jgi:hypothetical protein
MRKLSILFLALVVVLFFFAGYYLYIIPSNKASVDQYGMLVLEQLETAIEQKIDADIEQYSKNLEPYFREKEKKKKEDLSFIQQRFLQTFGVDSLGSMADTPGGSIDFYRLLAWTALAAWPILPPGRARRIKIKSRKRRPTVRKSGGNSATSGTGAYTTIFITAPVPWSCRCPYPG